MIINFNIILIVIVIDNHFHLYEVLKIEDKNNS